ncbi:MAG: hypothetical protein QNK82_06735 [Akkermansiaceae bacterium]
MVVIELGAFVETAGGVDLPGLLPLAFSVVVGGAPFAGGGEVSDSSPGSSLMALFPSATASLITSDHALPIDSGSAWQR